MAETTSAAAPKTSTTRTVTANSIWYGLETGLSVLMVFLTSIPIARALGPEQLGYFNYLQWLCGISAGLGSMGIPAAITKFMALYLSRGDGASARALFRYTLRAQSILAFAITAVGMGLIIAFGDPVRRGVSLLQVAVILPVMLTQIPTWANVATEQMRKNVASGIVADLVYLGAVWLSLSLHWNLMGIALGMLAAKIVECVMRFRVAQQWIREYPVGSLSPGEKKPIFRFASQQLYMSVIGALLWNKSDVVLLRWLSSDIRQVTFFTLAFNIIEKVVLLPQIIGGAMSVSLLAKTGDDPEKATKMTATATRYMLLFSAPLLLGLYVVAGPLVRVLYGPRYVETAPILAMAALLAMVKPLMGPAEALFRITAKQGRMLVWATICTVLNLGLDALLIPRHGAWGAAIGNGVGQGVLVVGYVAITVIWFGVELDYGTFARILLSAAAMWPAAWLFNRMLPGTAALAADVLAGAAVFVAMLRLTGALQKADLNRVGDVASMLPARLRPAAGATIRLLLGSPSPA